MEELNEHLQKQRLKDQEMLKKSFRSIESFYAASFSRLKILEEKIGEMKKEWENYQ